MAETWQNQKNCILKIDDEYYSKNEATNTGCAIGKGAGMITRSTNCAYPMT